MKRFLTNTVKTLNTKARGYKAWWWVIAVLVMGGCGPSYPKERVISDLERICREQGIAVQAQLVATTMVVYMPLEELFDIKMDFVPGTIEKIEQVVNLTSRVIFSSDAKIEFYALVVADVAATGAELVWIRYVDDIHRLMNGWISRDEYRKRVVWQVTFNAARPDAKLFDPGAFAALSLPEFLTRQLTQRLTAILENTSYRAVVRGSYTPLSGEIRFSLVAAEDTTFRRIYLPVIAREVADVMGQYRFRDFAVVVIENAYTKESITLAPEQLAEYLHIDTRSLLPPPEKRGTAPAA